MSYTATDRDLIVAMGAVCQAAMALTAAVIRAPQAEAPAAFASELEKLVDRGSYLTLLDARAGDIVRRLPELATALAEIRAEAPEDPGEENVDPWRLAGGSSRP